MRVVFILILISNISIPCLTQNLKNTTRLSKISDTNSIAIRKKFSTPTKHAIYSTILPGLGQAANKKYWKLPILYGGGFFLLYLWKNNAQGYKRFKRQIQYYSNTTGTPDVFYYDPVLQFTYTNLNQLKVERDRYRKHRDYAIVGSIALYVLNIMDAYVDAHLKTFDVSNDLSFRIKPGVDHTFTPCFYICFNVK